MQSKAHLITFENGKKYSIFQYLMGEHSQLEYCSELVCNPHHHLIQLTLPSFLKQYLCLEIGIEDWWSSVIGRPQDHGF